MTKNKLIGYCDRVILISLYLLIFCLPFSRAIIEITATASFFAWCVKRGCMRNFQVPKTALDLPIAVFILANLISVFVSIRPMLSLSAFFFKILEYIFIYYIVVDTIQNKKKFIVLLKVALVSCAMIVINGIVQYFTHTDFIRSRPWFNAPRISSTFDTGNDLGGYLITILPIIFCLTINGLKKIMTKIMLAVEGLILIVTLILTRSIGAFTGFLGSLIFVGLFRNKKTLMIIVLLVTVIFFAMPRYYAERTVNILKFEGPSVLDRNAAWHIGLEIIHDRPILGYGLSTFMTNYEKYNAIKNAPVIYAHNCYLQMAAETGIAGLLAFLYIIFMLFWKCTASLKKIEDKLYKSALLGLLGGLAAFLIHSGVDTNLYSLPLVTLFWFMMGLAVAVQQLGIEGLKAGDGA